MKLISRFLKSNSFFNISNEHVSMFTIEDGETIEKGDFVVVDTKTMHARKPLAKSGYFAVGVAKKILDLANGKQAVICVDGCHMIYDPDKVVQESDINNTCYFATPKSITLNSVNTTKAGTIAAIEVSDDPIDIADGTDRMVWIRNDIMKESDLEW